MADVRAATPSAAAEIVTEAVFASRELVATAPETLGFRVRQQLAQKAEAARQFSVRLARSHPRRRLNEWFQRLDDLQAGLLRCARQGTRDRRLHWRHLGERLWHLRPTTAALRRRERLAQEQRRLIEAVRHRFKSAGKDLETLEARLRLLGPEQVLARGYSITSDAETGKVLRDASGVQKGQRLKTRLQRGEVVSRAEGRPSAPARRAPKG